MFPQCPGTTESLRAKERAKSYIRTPGTSPSSHDDWRAGASQLSRLNGKLFLLVVRPSTPRACADIRNNMARTQLEDVVLISIPVFVGGEQPAC